MAEETSEEPTMFTNEELYAAIGRSLGVDSASESEPDRRSHPDPGTVTGNELEERYGLTKVQKSKALKHLEKEGILYPDWVWRYDRWPPYKKRRTKGYRYINKVPTEETQLDKQ